MVFVMSHRDLVRVSTRKIFLSGPTFVDFFIFIFLGGGVPLGAMQYDGKNNNIL